MIRSLSFQFLSISVKPTSGFITVYISWKLQIISTVNVLLFQCIIIWFASDNVAQRKYAIQISKTIDRTQKYSSSLYCRVIPQKILVALLFYNILLIMVTPTSLVKFWHLSLHCCKDFQVENLCSVWKSGGCDGIRYCHVWLVLNWFASTNLLVFPVYTIYKCLFLYWKCYTPQFMGMNCDKILEEEWIFCKTSCVSYWVGR